MILLEWSQNGGLDDTFPSAKIEPITSATLMIFRETYSTIVYARIYFLSQK